MWGNQGGGYDQNYGDQGGGYMNSPGQYGSPGASQEKKARSRAQNSMSVTAAQIQASQKDDDRFLLDNIELHQVTLVGLVRSVKETSTRVDYEIDDGTAAPMEVKQFIDNDENTPDEERVAPMRENTYVRVHGHVRAFQDKRNVAAFRVLPLTDMNELTTHLLEVVHCHLYLTKSQKAGGLPKGQSGPAGGTGYVPQPQTGGQNQNSMPDQGLTPAQSQVYHLIKGCPDEQGININYVCENLRGIPQKAIRDAVDFLSGEGHIFSTIDDEHYKATD